MIATMRKQNRFQVTEEQREQFLEMLPQIRRQALVAYRGLGAEAREEFVTAVLAAAFIGFARLVELGKTDIIYSSPLAKFAIKHVNSGRSVGTPINRQDLCSSYGRCHRGVRVQRLDQRHADGQWKEILVEDRHTRPADVAAARVDIASWFDSLPPSKRRIALALALGDATSSVAARYGLTSSRISQLRRELAESWGLFQGELPLSSARTTGLSPTRRLAPDRGLTVRA